MWILCMWPILHYIKGFIKETLNRSRENLKNEKQILAKISQATTINDPWIFSEFLADAF